MPKCVESKPSPEKVRMILFLMCAHFRTAGTNDRQACQQTNFGDLTSTMQIMRDMSVSVHAWHLCTFSHAVDMGDHSPKYQVIKT